MCSFPHVLSHEHVRNKLLIQQPDPTTKIQWNFPSKYGNKNISQLLALLYCHLCVSVRGRISQISDHIVVLGRLLTEEVVRFARRIDRTL